jgi:tricorn protease
MKRAITLIVCLVALSQTGGAVERPLLAQQPALSATHIVFVFAGDLWMVPRAGGDARRLTIGIGVESGPSFRQTGSRSPSPGSTMLERLLADVGRRQGVFPE